MNLFSRRPPPGAIILPRKVADQGQALWPKCARCMRSVDAYGIWNETDGSIEVWARCDGVRIDPATGRASGLSAPLHPSMRSSVTVLKGPGWSVNRFAEIVSKMAFFHPDGDRQFTQTIDRDTVRKRWGAG